MQHVQEHHNTAAQPHKDWDTSALGVALVNRRSQAHALHHTVCAARWTWGSARARASSGARCGGPAVELSVKLSVELSVARGAAGQRGGREGAAAVAARGRYPARL